MNVVWSMQGLVAMGMTVVVVVVVGVLVAVLGVLVCSFRLVAGGSPSGHGPDKDKCSISNWGMYDRRNP